jgi:hypothetical protein
VPRRSRAQITKELAIKIAKKLEAVNESDPGDEHDMYAVYHNDRLVAAFGVRRSSQRDKGHDHIPRELHVGPNFAKQLGQCTKYKPDYLKKIGEIETSGDEQVS